MKELIVTIDQEEKLKLYDYFSRYLLVSSSFSMGHLYGLDDDTIIRICNSNTSKDLYLLVDRVLFDKDLKSLEELIVKTKDNIKGYFFSDFSVFNILSRLGISNLGIYYSQTQIVSNLELEAFNDLGLESIFFSENATIQTIHHSRLDIKKGIMIYGYQNVFYSRRSLLSDFAKKTLQKSAFSQDVYLIKDQKRDEKNYIFENEHGTYIFTDYIVNHFKELVEFINIGFNLLLVDDNLIETKDFMRIVDSLKECKFPRPQNGEIDKYE